MQLHNNIGTTFIEKWAKVEPLPQLIHNGGLLGHPKTYHSMCLDKLGEAYEGWIRVGEEEERLRNKRGLEVERGKGEIEKAPRARVLS